MPSFIPGLRLAEILFREAVEPLLADHMPSLRYAAGLAGGGSDAMGFDTERSTDHGWGPRLVLFLDDEDIDSWTPRLNNLLQTSLSRTIAGYSTSFIESEIEPGIMHMAEIDSDQPVNHQIAITSPKRWLRQTLGVDVTDRIDPATWTTLSEQTLLEVTSGKIFRDDSGEITRLRAGLAWYLDDVWRYRMAAQWKRIDQLEPFIGRCGEVGDDLGSHLVAMTLVRDAMKLAYLMERRYAPYPKWIGTGFTRLNLAPELTPDLDAARFATNWREREAGVVGAVAALAEHHNTLGLTAWVDPTPRPFFGRPFQVMFGGRFAEALMATITDPEVLALPAHLGGLDQYIDSTDAMNSHGLHRAIREWLIRE